MITKTDYEELLKRINDLSREVEDIRRIILQEKPADKDNSREAWESLENLSKKVSEKWKGPSATEEIRNQRDKSHQ